MPHAPIPWSWTQHGRKAGVVVVPSASTVGKYGTAVAVIGARVVMNTHLALRHPKVHI